MSVSFLAPWILAGLGGLLLPWLIHRIRRPERETVRFSSLMFIPDLKRKVIERRSVQHRLLMILRMAALALLVLSFARPYRAEVSRMQPVLRSAIHVLILDCSFSMANGDRWTAAKRAAREIADSLSPDDRVGLVAFHRRIERIEPPLLDGETRMDNHARIQAAIDSLSLTEESTDYIPALQTAQELVLRESGTYPEPRRILHLISDLQASGVPRGFSWHLSSRTQLQIVPILPELENRVAVTEAAFLRKQWRSFRLLGQMKNFTEQSVKVSVNAVVDKNRLFTQTVEILPGFTSKVVFDATLEDTQPHSGYLQIETEDSLWSDNRREVSWNPPIKKRVALLSRSADLAKGSPAWFLSQGIRLSENREWELDVVNGVDLQANALSKETYPVVICFSDSLSSSEAVASLLSYVQSGGVLTWLPGSDREPDAAWNPLFRAANLAVDFASPSAESPRVLSWVDFSHPLFQAFRDSRFNDFTSIRVTSPPGFKVLGDASGKVREIARFDEGSPALVESACGNGRMLVWAFAPGSERGRLEKSPKFVPLLFELLRYAGGEPIKEREWIVGETLHPPEGFLFPIRCRLPGDEWIDYSGEPFRVHHSGIVQWERDGGAPLFFETVGKEPKESEPATLNPAVFYSLFAPAIANPLVLQEREGSDRLEPSLPDRQSGMGHGFLYALLVGCLLEFGYSVRLARSSAKSARISSKE